MKRLRLVALLLCLPVTFTFAANLMQISGKTSGNVNLPSFPVSQHYPIHIPLCRESGSLLFANTNRNTVFIKIVGLESEMSGDLLSVSGSVTESGSPLNPAIAGGKKFHHAMADSVLNSGRAPFKDSSYCKIASSRMMCSRHVDLVIRVIK